MQTCRPSGFLLTFCHGATRVHTRTRLAEDANKLDLLRTCGSSSNPKPKAVGFSVGFGDVAFAVQSSVL